MRTLLLLALCASIALAAHFSMPIRKKVTSANEIELRRIAKQPVVNKFTSELKVGSQPFIDYIDNFYLGDINLGTPGQIFQIVLDTGSSNLWVIDSSCTAQECLGFPNPLFGNFKKHRYDHSKSSTYKPDGRNFAIRYGSGSCEGKLSIDALEMGGLKYPNATFGAASSIARVFGYQPVDGILGLGWPQIADDKVTPPIQDILDQLDAPLFTVWLDRHVKPSEGQAGGLITYGALDGKNCDAQIDYVPLTKLGYWQFKLDNFGVDTYKSNKAQQVISDTGTSFLYGPTASYRAIIRATKAKFNSRYGLYTVSCNSVKNLPDLKFTIGGKVFSVAATEYVVDLEIPNNECAVGASSFDFNVIDWILGDSFIRSYCNIYDVGQKRIGFAKAHHTEI